MSSVRCLVGEGWAKELSTKTILCFFTTLLPGWCKNNDPLQTSITLSQLKKLLKKDTCPNFLRIVLRKIRESRVEARCYEIMKNKRKYIPEAMNEKKKKRKDWSFRYDSLATNKSSKFPITSSCTPFESISMRFKEYPKELLIIRSIFHFNATLNTLRC